MHLFQENKKKTIVWIFMQWTNVWISLHILTNGIRISWFRKWRHFWKFIHICSFFVFVSFCFPFNFYQFRFHPKYDEFWIIHCFLSLISPQQWRTIASGMKNYGISGNPNFVFVHHFACTNTSLQQSKRSKFSQYLKRFF